MRVDPELSENSWLKFGRGRTLAALTAIALIAVGIGAQQSQGLPPEARDDWLKRSVRDQISMIAHEVRTFGSTLSTTNRFGVELDEELERFVIHNRSIHNLFFVDDNSHMRAAARRDGTSRAVYGELEFHADEDSAPPGTTEPTTVTLDRAGALADSVVAIWIRSPSQFDGAFVALVDIDLLLSLATPDWQSWSTTVTRRDTPDPPETVSVELPGGVAKLQSKWSPPANSEVTVWLVLASIFGLTAAVGFWVRSRHAPGIEEGDEEEESIVEQALESACHGIVVLDETGTIVSINSAARALIGDAKVGDSGLTWMGRTCVRANDQQPYTAEELPIARALRGQRARNIELIVSHPGSPNGVPVRISALPILHEDVVTGVMLVAGDYTEEKLIQEEFVRTRNDAIEANHARTVFLSYLSQELRTPVHEIMESTRLDESRDEDVFPAVQQNAQSLLSLLDDILALSKIEAGITRCRTVLLDPIAALHEAQTAIRGSGVVACELIVESSRALPQKIESDVSLLRQLLHNVIDVVSRRAEVDQLKVVCRASDLGDGGGYFTFEFTDVRLEVSGEELRDLYTAYAKADAATMLLHGTGGLRLAIAKRVAQMLGGDLALRTHADGSTDLLARVSCGAATQQKITSFGSSTRRQKRSPDDETTVVRRIPHDTPAADYPRVVAAELKDLDLSESETKELRLPNVDTYSAPPLDQPNDLDEVTEVFVYNESNLCVQLPDPETVERSSRNQAPKTETVVIRKVY